MTKDISPQSCVYINCDGASRNNPGLSAIGICIKGEDNRTVLKEIGECIGHATNNVAEYKAVIKALDVAGEFTNRKVVIKSDSELLIKQTTKQYRVKNAVLRKLMLEIKSLERLYEEVSYIHIPREKNNLADALANKALEEI